MRLRAPYFNYLFHLHNTANFPHCIIQGYSDNYRQSLQDAIFELLKRQILKIRQGLVWYFKFKYQESKINVCMTIVTLKYLVKVHSTQELSWIKTETAYFLTFTVTDLSELVLNLYILLLL